MSVQVGKEIPFLGHVSFNVIVKIAQVSNLAIEISRETADAILRWFEKEIETEGRSVLQEMGIVGYIGKSVLKINSMLRFSQLIMKVPNNDDALMFSINDPQIEWSDWKNRGENLGFWPIEKIICKIEDDESFETLYFPENNFIRSLSGTTYYSDLLVKHGSKIKTIPVKNTFFIMSEDKVYWGKVEDYF